MASEWVLHLMQWLICRYYVNVKIAELDGRKQELLARIAGSAVYFVWMTGRLKRCLSWPTAAKATNSMKVKVSFLMIFSYYSVLLMFDILGLVDIDNNLPVIFA